MLNVERMPLLSPHLLAVGAVLLAGSCGDSVTEPESNLITVEFEAAGVVDRDGEPVAGAHIALIRCDLEGPDGCEIEKTMAMAMTGPDGKYALSYLCVCDPSEGLSSHFLAVELPAVPGWQLFGDPRERSRKGRFEIETECVERLEVEHEFHLGS